MQMIFDEGKDIHLKWQKRIWDIGRLWGTFYCQNCHYAWGATAPQECESCHSPREFLHYHEVPLANPSLHMVGHADGGVEDSLIEIKSIGVGTLRYEAPGLIKDHTYRFNLNGKPREFLDYDGLWKAIRQPFPSHVRQGDFYCFLHQRASEVIFLYEWKVAQNMKEFVVHYCKERIESRLDQCRQITMALQGGRIPKCPFGGCADCERYEEKNVSQGGRVLVRRASSPAAAPAGPARNGAKNEGRRLSRLGD